MRSLTSAIGSLLLGLVLSAPAAADDPFQQQVLPFLQTYCLQCHNAAKASGQLNLARYATAAAVGEDFRQWETVLTFLRKEEMPPADADQPAAARRAEVVAAIEGLLAAEAKRLAGDPGVVLPRRLSNAEYNNTIRDLTGFDIRPADSFPVDPAAGEGFNNTGEALTMSPSLFKKYYAAAQHVAEHVLLTPSGIRFAPFPVVTYADQMKFYEQAVIRFYEEHSPAYEKYLTAAWSYRYRPASRQAATIEDWALEHQLSPSYLRRLWDTLSVPASDDAFYLGSLRRAWHALPPPADLASPVAPSNLAPQIEILAANIRRASKLLCAKETPAITAFSHLGNAPIPHIERRKKSAAERDTLDENMVAPNRRLQIIFERPTQKPTLTLHLRAANLTDAAGPSYVILDQLNFTGRPFSDYNPTKQNPMTLRSILLEHAPGEWEKLKPGVHPLGHAIGPDSIVLSTATPLEITVPTKAFAKRLDVRYFYVDAALDAEHSCQPVVRVAAAGEPVTVDEFSPLVFAPQETRLAQLKQSSLELCRTFPNRFVYVDDTRGLSAGFHLVEGVFRDDQPLCRLVLGDAEKRELDRLWEELLYGANMAEKTLRGFVFFERAERNILQHADFDFIVEEDPELVRDEKVDRFEQVYFAHTAGKLQEEFSPTHPIRLFFAEIRRGLHLRRQQLVAATPLYLRQLLEFAEQAYRRPLTDSERSTLSRFYEATCRQPELGVEQAVRGVATSILVSPHFCCRIDLPPAGDTVRPLSDVALASRLSYFLWSSMPDTELMALAKAGRLNDEPTLRQQTRRMLADPKVAGFALEFFGQWLRYRDFLEEESVDRKVFPAFNDELKQAMFEEPTRVIAWLIQHDRPVTDVLYGNGTLVNKPLAQHYGMPYSVANDAWQQVDGLDKYGRGGVLGMAVFLTRNSQPQRTSPVKRGFWVVHKILGEHIPAPPNEVPPLPAKETETGGKTIRELLALHTQSQTCARCHRRFDALGLAMEGFDPVGKARGKDLAGRPVDNVVRLPSGDEARGVPEFLQYLRRARNDDFIRTLCRKFLGYALARSLELSDHELLETLERDLREHDYRFATLFETVVCSPQFRNQRCRDFTLARFRAESGN